MGLKDARRKRDEYRYEIYDGIDRAEKRKAKLASAKKAVENGFKRTAREWFLIKKDSWAPGYPRTVIDRFERNIFPWRGDKDVDDITPVEILDALGRIESRGANETAPRVLSLCGQVFKYAISTVRTLKNPCSNLGPALKPALTTHFSAITDPKKRVRPHLKNVR